MADGSQPKLKVDIFKLRFGIVASGSVTTSRYGTARAKQGIIVCEYM
jgi:hypothetical protein